VGARFCAPENSGCGILFQHAKAPLLPLPLRAQKIGVLCAAAYSTPGMEPL